MAFISETGLGFGLLFPQVPIPVLLNVSFRSSLATFLDLSWDAWMTLVVILGVVIALVREWTRPDVVFLGALTLLLVAGVLTPETAFAGFSSSAVLSIAALYVVAAGMQQTDALAFTDRLLFSNSSRLTLQIARLSMTTALMSGVVNNTPLVAILIPRLQQWARRQGVPVSKVMIPLSYAAVLGGLLTLIGTSTNLVVSGLLYEATGQSLSMFDLTWIGLPAVVAGVLYLSLVAHRLLPNHSGPRLPRESGATRYHFDLRVPSNSALVGKRLRTAFGADLGHLPIGRQRGNGDPEPVQTSDTIESGDIFLFAGSVSLAQTLHAHPDLERLPGVHVNDEGPLTLYEAVLSNSSSLVGQPLRAATFSDSNRVAVLAIHREDQGVPSRFHQTPLRGGDLLLIEAPTSFYERGTGAKNDFYFVAPYRAASAPSLRREKAPVSLAILGAMVLCTATGIVPLLTAALVAVFALLGTGCLRLSECRQRIDLPVLIMIGAAFGLSQALQGTGLATMLAGGVLGATKGLGVFATLALLYLVTFVLTELLTNAAAAALVFPTALEVSVSMGADPIPFALVVAVAASAGFATPFGYQTNLMVMSVGGYRFMDYVRAGLPLNLIVMVVALLSVWLFWS